MEAAAPLTLPHCPLTRSPPHTLTPPAGLAELRKCTVRDLLFADPQLLRLLGSSLPARPVRRCVCWGGGGKGGEGRGQGKERARVRAHASSALRACAAARPRQPHTRHRHARTHAPHPCRSCLWSCQSCWASRCARWQPTCCPTCAWGDRACDPSSLGAAQGGGGGRGDWGGVREGARRTAQHACVHACPRSRGDAPSPPPPPRCCLRWWQRGTSLAWRRWRRRRGWSLAASCETTRTRWAGRVCGVGAAAPPSSGVGMRHAQAGWACATLMRGGHALREGAPRRPPPPLPGGGARVLRGGGTAP